MTEEHDDGVRHTETVLFANRDGLTAVYRIDGFSDIGLDLTRLPENEFGHDETWTWNEIARGIRNQTIRIYGMTPEEVENIGQ